MQAKALLSHDANRSPARVWVMWLLLGTLSGAVWAQSATQAPAAVDREKAVGPHEQRRAALRAALQAQHEAQAPKPEPEPQRTVRQLTPTERAKLREQLRQQRRQEPSRAEQPDRNSQSQ